MNLTAKLLTAYLLTTLVGCAGVVPTKASRYADGGQLADVGSTALAIAAGGVEANPLGLWILPLKYGTLELVKRQSVEVQEQALPVLGAVGWGAAVNNLCVALMLVTGGSSAVVCPVAGLGAGIWSYRKELDRIEVEGLGVLP